MIQYFLYTIHSGLRSAKVCDIPYSSLLMILFSFSLWTLTYVMAKQIFNSKTAEFCIRIVTFIHGLSTTITSINLCFFNERKCLVNEPNMASTDAEKLLMVTNLGYFILDLIWSIYNQTETNLMLLHHVYAIAALYYVLKRAVGGGQFACGMAAMECTNPLLQSRWFLRSLGYNKTMLFDTVEILFMALFILIRIILGTMAMLVVFTDERIDWIFTLNTSIIYSLSWMFVYNMCIYVMAKYFEKGITVQQSESNYEVTM